MKILLLIFSFFWVMFFTSCNTKKQALSRQHLQMPKLLDFKSFKNSLPLEGWTAARDSSLKTEFVLPVYNYFFSIDALGNVTDGKFDTNPEQYCSFFREYINNIFNNYKWSPACYKYDKQDKLNSVAHLSFFHDYDRNRFEVSIRLDYLPGKEKLDDIFDEKNLIYKFKVR